MSRDTIRTFCKTIVEGHLEFDIASPITDLTAKILYL